MSRRPLHYLATAVLIGTTVPAAAQVHPEKPTYKYEKCYGIAKAGRNDCFTATNSCGGTATHDNDPRFWSYIPAGTCLKMGGSLQPGAQDKQV